MDEKTRQIRFVTTVLVDKILAHNDQFKGHKVVSAVGDLNQQLEGFMSNILTLDLKTQSPDGKEETHAIIVKLMKGSVEFRTTSKSYTQFSNEVFYYTDVINAFQKVLTKAGITSIDTNNWVPKLLFGDYNLYPTLSDTYESILAVENLKIPGFRNGPRLELDKTHIYMMTKIIAEFHSLTYAMRIRKDPQLQTLIKGIKPLPFKEPDGSRNIFNVVYGVAFDRFFEYLGRTPDQCNNPEQFKQDMDVMKKKFGSQPVEILEYFRTDDPDFSVILHGDYNRNNVMFHYDSESGHENPKELRMIDFQEARYGSPACDLTFFMYFNMTPELREEIWDDVLKYYHDTVMETLSQILAVRKDDPLLRPYSWDKFLAHFSRFAFYGVLVSIHFLPWMMCPEVECDKLSSLFTKDMQSKEFYDYVMIAGGDEPNLRMTQCAKHASAKGYTNFLHTL